MSLKIDDLLLATPERENKKLKVEEESTDSEDAGKRASGHSRCSSLDISIFELR